VHGQHENEEEDKHNQEDKNNEADTIEPPNKKAAKAFTVDLDASDNEEFGNDDEEVRRQKRELQEKKLKKKLEELERKNLRRKTQ
jgi:hypothetical protein